jgi:cell division protein FtsL
MVAAPAGGGAAAGLPRRGTTGLFDRVRALPDLRVVDRLLRSRLWIWALGVLLLGIVTMQVSLLKLNSGISRAVETTTTLERQNAALEQSIAKLSATDRIQKGAEALGLILPAAGDVGYLTAGPEDAKRAADRMQPPSEEARALLANGGVEPGALITAAPVTTAASVATDPATTATTPAVTDPATTTTETPVAPETATDPTTPVATPTPTTTTTTTTTTSPSGGAVAPQG